MRGLLREFRTKRTLIREELQPERQFAKADAVLVEKLERGHVQEMIGELGFNAGEHCSGLSGRLALECAIDVDEGAVIRYHGCKDNSGCTNKSEIFIWQPGLEDLKSKDQFMTGFQKGQNEDREISSDFLCF
jgi:hypothetical protein